MIEKLIFNGHLSFYDLWKKQCEIIDWINKPLSEKIAEEALSKVFDKQGKDNPEKTVNQLSQPAVCDIVASEHDEITRDMANSCWRCKCGKVKYE